MMESPDIPAFPGPVAGVYMVGSHAIYGEGKDIDYIVLVGNLLDWVANSDDWEHDGGYIADSAEFVSLRKGKFNLIVTDKTWLFESFIAATDMMRMLEHVVPQSDKVKRVMLYELVRSWYKEYANG